MDELRAKLILTAIVFTAACADARNGDTPPAPPATVGQGGAPYSIDSALKIFRIGLDPISELESAQGSIGETAARFARMVEQSDTTAMRAMVMTRREFAYLYYPTSPFTRPPTMQEPGLVWFLHVQASQKGAGRLLDQYGRRPFRLLSNTCQPPRIQGENRIWDDCIQRVVEGSDTSAIRLFGGMIERHGRFKIFSYANDL